MADIDPATGIPLALTTPNPEALPPGFVPQFQQPIPGTAPIPGAPLPPGFVPNPADALPPPAPAPVPSLFNPLPPPPPAAPANIAPQAPAPVPQPHANSHAQPGLVQQFDKQIAASQAQQTQAAADLAATQQQGANDVAAARGEQSKEKLALAGELIAKQQEIQKHNAALDAIDAANLKQAKDATIPDFWKSRTGKLVGATVSVALAGIGAGLLGSTNNEALNNIQHNIDQYFHNQKDRIDNLYKYAEAQGRLNTQTRLQYAQDLLNLKDQHSYVMQAAADHVLEVADKSKGAADAATTKFMASKLGEQAIKDKMDVRELRSKMMLQEAQAEAARGNAAESRARAAQGGYLTPAQASGQAIQIVNQLDRQYKYVNDPKTGLAAHERELGGKLKAIQDNPNNPANWVALVDSAIKTNTGKAAIMSQYNLYMGHAAGANDNVDQVLEKFRTGLPSKAQQQAILGAAQQGYNEITSMAGEANKTYHEAVDTNPLIAQNPAARAMVAQHERSTFGGFPNYGKHETVLAPGQAPAAAAAPAKPQQIKTPDGVIHNLNPATGQYD